MASLARDAAWLFESLGLNDALPEAKREKITIPDTLIFKRDESTGRLQLSAWLTTAAKTGSVVRKPAAEFLSQMRKWRDKLVAASPPGQQLAVAQAFGFDGVGQGVPPAGLDNLLADLENGALEGITMLQAKVKLGPKPAGHFEVEVSVEGGKQQLKARIAQSEIITPAAGAALRSLRDDLLALGKRIVSAAEGGRRGVRVQSAVLEFVADSAAQPGLHLVGAYNIRSTPAEGEAVPADGSAAGMPGSLSMGAVGMAEGSSTALPSPTARTDAMGRTMTGGDIETVYIDGGAGAGQGQQQGQYPYGMDPAQAQAMMMAQQQQQAAAMGMGMPLPGQMLPMYPGVPPFGYGFQGMQVDPSAFAAQQQGGAGATTGRNAGDKSPPRGRSISPSHKGGRRTGQPAGGLGSPVQTGGTWADKVGSSSPTQAGGTASGAAAEVVSALKKQVQELQSQLQAARLAAYAPPKTSAMVLKGEPKEVAEARAAGRFEYKEEGLPAADAPREAVEEVVRRLQLRWREALDLAEVVQSAYGREAGEAISRLIEAHKRELVEMKTAFETMEDNVAQTNARLNAAGLELAAASRREQAAMDRATRLMNENRRLANELQTAMANQRGSPAALPSPNLPPGLPRRPSFSQRGSNVSRAGAEILGLGSGAALPSPSGGEGEISFTSHASDGAGGGGGALASAQAALLTLQAQVRTTQLELETTRDNLASESASRQELAQANAKLLEEFRLERRRLKAQLAHMEDAEKARVAGMFSMGRAGVAAAAAAAAAASATPAGPSSADLSALLAKVSEAEELQSQLAVAKAELSEARQATSSAAAGRIDAVRQLEALQPVMASLEAETAALRHEVMALRGGLTPSSFSTSEASGASDRAAAARASADANLARTELRTVREQLDRTRHDAQKLQEQITALRSTRSMEVESVRQAERAERDRVIREMSASHDQALRAALSSVQDEANKRFTAATSRLQDEVMSLSSKLQAAAGEAAQLKVRLKTVESDSKADGARDSQEAASLRASLEVAQSQVKQLAGELSMIRDAAARQAFEISSQANAQFAALQAQHSQALEIAKRDVETAVVERMRVLVEEANAAAEASIAAIKAQSAADLDALTAASAEERAKLLASEESKQKAALASLEAEMQAKQATAIAEALTAARASWEGAATAAMEAMRDGGVQTAKEMADGAAAAARKEVASQLGAQLQQLEQALAVERAQNAHMQQQLAAKDSAITSLLSDIRLQAQQMQEAQARAVATAEATATENANRQANLRLAEAEAAWTKDREAAVRNAVEKTKGEAQAAFDRERQAFSKASEQAAEAMLSEADALVTSAKAEALRDKEAALAALRAELTRQYESTAAAGNRDVANVLQQRDAAIAAIEARHNQAMAEASQLVTNLQENLARAQARAAKAEEEGRAALVEAEAKLMAVMEERVRLVEQSWVDKAAVLQSDNEKAAGIIAGLLHEADEATRRANDSNSTLAGVREAMNREIADLRATVDNLRGEMARKHAAAEEAARQAADKHTSEMQTARDSWVKEKTGMEAAFASERVSLMGLAQAQEGAAMAAVEELRGRFTAVQAEEISRLRAEAANEMFGLRTQHANEMQALQARLAEDKEAALAAARADAASKAAQAIQRVREESNAAAEARIAALEADVARELNAAARAASESQQVAVTAMEASHAQEVAALRADFNNKLENAARALAQTEQMAQQQIATMRGAFEQEAQTIRENSVPLTVVQELRDKMEAQAVAALTSAVDEAVAAARREAEQLNAVLRQRIDEQDADRKALSSQLDMLQEAVTAQMAASTEHLTAARLRAEAAEMATEDLRSAAAARAPVLGPDGKPLPGPDVQAMVTNRVTEMAGLLEAELKQRMEEMAAAARAQAEIFNTAREALLAEKSAAETQMVAMQAATAEAVAERDSRIMELSAAAEALARDLEYARGPAVEELKAAMRASFEQERGVVEAKAAEAVAAAVTEAIAAGEAAKLAALDEMRRHYEDRFREFESEARNLQAALTSSLEARHQAEMEAASRAALADRDNALGVLLSDRLKSLEDAQRVAQSMLDAAKMEHETSLAHLRALHNQETANLIESHRQEMESALNAAKAETERLLKEQDEAWKEKAAAMLAKAAEEQVRAIAALQKAFQEKIAALNARMETQGMAAEEERQHHLEFAEAGVVSAVAAARAAGEADKIAALGVFNAEWADRMQARVAELLEEREAELAAVRSQYQAQLDETVARLEAQRVAALEAFTAEFNAERERLIQEKIQAVAEATQTERAAGEAALALALSKAREEREAALAEQAAVLAEERARAIDAVRVQATEEQEEAMDALRAESEKLLTSIEGAMTRLRDERDLAQENEAVLKEQLEAEKKLTAELEAMASGLRRAGVVMRLHLFLIVTRFAGVLEHTKRTMKAEHEAHVAQLKAEAAAALAAEKEVTAMFKAKFRTLVKMRAVLAETLTSFKRDQLVEHRVKSTTLAQELASLSEEKAQLAKQAQFHSAQVAEVEGTVRAIEREMAELSKQSVIEADGTVNVALTRKKKRLDRDMDAALVKINDRRTAQSEVEKKAKDLEEERAKKEEALKEVEAGLVNTLVSQQRALMSVVTSLPLSQDDITLSREEAAELGLLSPEDVAEMEMMAERQARGEGEDREGGSGEEGKQDGHGGEDGQQHDGGGMSHAASSMAGPSAEAEGKMDPAQAAAQAQFAASMNAQALMQAQQQLGQLQAMAQAGQLPPQGAAMMQQLQMQIAMTMQAQQQGGMGMGMGMPPMGMSMLMGQTGGTPPPDAPPSPSKVALFWGNTMPPGGLGGGDMAAPEPVQGRGKAGGAGSGPSRSSSRNAQGGKKK